MKKLIESRWFALADLACVITAIVLLEFVSGLSWRALLLVLLPWLLRLLAGKSPFKRSPFDIPIAIFLLTAGAGVWAAYNKELAWTKFWLLVAAVLLFYSIAGQLKENLWLVAGILGSAGVLMSAYYLLTHDWQVEPAKFGILNQIGISWQILRPRFIAQRVHANTVAGIVGILAPFLIAAVIHAWRERYYAIATFGTLGVVISLVCLVLTTSRGAWLASLLAIGIILLWILCKKIADRAPLKPGLLFGSALVLVDVLIAGLLLGSPSVQNAFAAGFPQVPPVDISRLALYQGVAKLVEDFPFTGGGLGSFPGLLSEYVAMYPSPLLFHSHNTLLDIALEQGIIGLLSVAWILFGSIILLALSNVNEDLSLLRWAVVTSLSILVIHGLFDDVVYYVTQAKNAPLLFVPAGMAVAVVQVGLRASVRTNQAAVKNILLPGVTILFLLLLAGLFYRPLLSVWKANLGAVAMARAELPEKIQGGWVDRNSSIALTPAERLFHQSLELNPQDRTSNHRLGLIALQSEDFLHAILYLERAYQVDPNHRGIRKALGYSYLWNGQLEQAYSLLSGMNEVSYELYNYPLYWRNQGREGQARYAEQIYARFH